MGSATKGVYQGFILKIDKLTTCLVYGVDSRTGGKEMKHPVALQFRKEEEGEQWQSKVGPFPDPSASYSYPPSRMSKSRVGRRDRTLTPLGKQPGGRWKSHFTCL